MLQKLRKALIVTLAATGLFVASGQIAMANPGCHDAGLFQKMITDFCWNCVLPIRVAGVPISGSGRAPEGAVNSVFCVCTDNLGVPMPGIATSMWEPSRLIEFQRVPGCSSVLGGIQLPLSRATFLGTHGEAGGSSDTHTFTHYHYYAFPIMLMMDLFVANCGNDHYVDLDIMFLSEVDPTWINDELAFFTNPEAAAVSNPAAILACMADAVASTAGRPIKEMFWCAGSWGGIYPFSGNITGASGIIQDTSLAKVKTLAALHRRGMAWKTMGDDAMCGGYIHPTLPKQQYKFSLFHPVPETKQAHVMGQSTLTWGYSRTIPGIGEDPVYTIWRWNDCCNH